jgi:hypothetical protein
MGLKEKLEQAQRGQQLADETRRTAALTQEQNDRDRRLREQQELDAKEAELISQLENFTQRSNLPQLLQEAVVVLKSQKLGKVQLESRRGVGYENGIREYENRDFILHIGHYSAFINEYFLKWGFEDLVWNEHPNRRPTFFELWSPLQPANPAKIATFWNSINVQINSLGLIEINSQKITPEIWQQDPSTIETALTSAIMNPERSDDIPHVPNVNPPSR